MSSVPDTRSSPADSAAASPAASSFPLFAFLIFSFFLYFFGSPFQTNHELKKFNVYLVVSSALYMWLLATIALNTVPFFTGKHNAVIAASIFFPIFLSTFATFLLCKGLLRVVANLTLPPPVPPPSVASLPSASPALVPPLSPSLKPPPPQTPPPPSSSPLWTLPWYRPLRTVARFSLFLTLSLVFLQAHCWSRDANAFKGSDSGGGSLCGFFFDGGSPVAASAIWRIWGAGLSLSMALFLADGYKIARIRHRRICGGNMGGKGDEEHPDDDGTETEGGDASKTGGDKGSVERPEGVLNMVPWYSILLISTAFDIIIQLKFFLGRYDARTMQPALHNTWGGQRRTGVPKSKKSKKKSKKSKKNSKAGEATVPPPQASSPEPANRSASLYPSDDSEEDSDDSEADTPSGETAGCFFDHSTPRSPDGDFWFDFMADCGDGFNPSYQVARCLADPRLTVLQKDKKVKRLLPRGELLIVGGDLAYPDPTIENYESRFFRTFEDAMPPPPSFRKEAISTRKPALPVKGWRGIFSADEREPNNEKRNMSTNARDGEALRKDYVGPVAYVLPGNHDWFDGLAVYTRLILSRDWLGGWLMPQERSYFVIQLPHGWWIFGADLALAEDIDMEQYKFFADAATRRVGPDDAVIIITHEPYWVINNMEKRPPGRMSERNLTELMNTHLSGKVRVRLAGDLHHYTRHVRDAETAMHIPAQVGPKNGKKEEGNDASANYTPTYYNTYSPAADGGDLAAQARKIASMKKRDKSPDGSSFLRDLPDPITYSKPPDSEENFPELIVAGGGGAFLHPTHCFEAKIAVGEAQVPYKRLVAYPSEHACYRLSWMNMWQFRWRNWRMDILWGFLYIGLASSLVPLCGVYADFSAHTHDYGHGIGSVIFWVAKKTMYLHGCVFYSGFLSALLTIATILGLFQLCDENMPKLQRVLWGFGHGFLHTTCAFATLLFVECVAEWVVAEGIIRVSDSTTSTSTLGSGDTLADSMYVEYKHHFKDLAEDAAKKLLESRSDSLYGRMYEILAVCITWIAKTFPIIRGLLVVFDLPGQIAANHVSMCSVLCSGGAPCFGTKVSASFMNIDRIMIVKYMLSTGLYIFVVAVPVAGAVFGTWLALTLNVFKAQYNEGFSSLRIQHWKNFVRCHIKPSGDLEIFGIGLDKVPVSWVRDENWGGSKESKRMRDRKEAIKMKLSKKLEGSIIDDVPSWKWETPSKWRPEAEILTNIPRLIDHTLIPKRHERGSASRSMSFANEGAIPEQVPAADRFSEMPFFRRQNSF